MKSEVLILGGIGGHAGQAESIGIFLKKTGVKFDVLTLRGTEWRFKGLAERVMTAPQVLEPVTARFNPRSLIPLLIKLMRLGRYKVVIANGSNFAAPPSLWERFLGAKLINVEATDAVIKPTRTPLFLHKFATMTLVSWKELLKYYPGAKVVGPIFEPPRYEPRDEGYILVTAGTMGYRKLFDKAVELLSDEFELVIQTGKVSPEPYKHKAKEVFRFSRDFHFWLSGARAVIAVYPSTTAITASLAYGKPVVMVLNEELPRSTPWENMKPLAEKIGAVISNLEDLKEALEKTLKMKPPRYENGAKKVAEEVMALL